MGNERSLQVILLIFSAYDVFKYMQNAHIFNRNSVALEDENKGTVNWETMAMVGLKRRVQSGELLCQCCEPGCKKKARQ